MECGIFGVESRNDCRMEDDGLYHGFGFNNHWTFLWGKGAPQIGPGWNWLTSPSPRLVPRTNGPTFRTRVDAKVSDRTSSQGGISPYQTLFNHLENMAPHSSQTTTFIHFTGHPQKSALVAGFAEKHLRQLRTPAFVVDRHVFSKNCARMHANAAGYGAAFRAHLKTHKVINRSGAV